MKIIQVALIFFCVIFFVIAGCGKKQEAGKGQDMPAEDKKTQEVILDEDKTNEPSDMSAAGSQVVTIRNHVKEPKSANDENNFFIKGREANEFVEIIVKGEISDFCLVTVAFDENTSDLTEKNTVEIIESVMDRTIIIQTVVPEGVPSEMIKWKSKSGRAYKHIIQHDGVDSTAAKVYQIK